MKQVLIISISILFSSIMFAQEFNGGLYGSAVMMQLDGDWYGGYNKVGFAAGGYVNRFVKKDALAFQMGLRYIQKGSRATNNQYKCSLHYVEMPITLLIKLNDKFKIKSNNNSVNLNRFFFEAGVTLGYLIKSKDFINEVEEIDPPPFNKMELGFIGGINYEISDKLSVGAHFQYSILNVRPHSQSGFIKGGQYNNILTLTFAYKLSNWR